MKTGITNIKGGIYLVADGGIKINTLTEKLQKALEAGISIIQLYNISDDSEESIRQINSLCRLAHRLGVPVLINNNWGLVNHTLLDGVHFDKIPDDYAHIEKAIQKKCLKGITCTNDLDIIRWADENYFDYVSFCSMFPSPTVSSCEIVSFETVKKARTLTRMPVFLAGGINPETIQKLSPLAFDGIAVVSGIMSSPDITLHTKKYLSELNKIQQHESRNH